MIMKLYFSYGSNLDLAAMQDRCPQAKVLTPGCLRGFQLAFTWYSNGWSCGVADVVENAQGEVWGLVYSITNGDLAALDRYEGYPRCYGRSLTTIASKDATLENVWVYTVQEKSDFIAPSQSYMEIIKRACVDHNFPDSYARMLDQVPVFEG